LRVREFVGDEINGFEIQIKPIQSTHRLGFVILDGEGSP
jgi:hypothetical protein